MSYADKSTPELFEILFTGEYEDPAGDLLVVGPSAALRQLKDREDAPELAEHFLSSVVPTQRARSLDVLARHGSHRELAIAYLKDLDPTVVESAVYALGSWHGNPVHPAILAVRSHSSPDVRLGLAKGLQSDMPETPRVLMQLMKDSDENVRDWATFTLGIQTQYDSQEIREVIRARLQDNFEDARDEAVWALALRRDPQGLRLLLNRLEADHYKSGDESTACNVLDLPDADVDDLCDGLRALLG